MIPLSTLTAETLRDNMYLTTPYEIGFIFLFMLLICIFWTVAITFYQSEHFKKFIKKEGLEKKYEDFCSQKKKLKEVYG